MNIDKAKALVKEKLPEKRFEHSLRVAKTAEEMAILFHEDVEKSVFAGVLHDYCKYDDDSDMKQLIAKHNLSSLYLNYGNAILHGPAAACLLKEKLNIQDVDILNAIEYHTSGRGDMSTLEKIIFVADYIEPKRTTPGVDEIRNMIFKDKDLDRAVFEISKRNIVYLAGKEVRIFEKTIECYNYYN